MIHGTGEYEDMAGGAYQIEYSFGYHPSAKGFVADFGGLNRYEKSMDERERRKKSKKPN